MVVWAEWKNPGTLCLSTEKGIPGLLCWRSQVACGGVQVTPTIIREDCWNRLVPICNFHLKVIVLECKGV